MSIRYPGRILAWLALAWTALMGAQAHAFPVLNLTPGIPDIESSFITVDYVSSTGALTASGYALTLEYPKSTVANIVGGTFEIDAKVDAGAMTASGTLTIGGTIAGLGFNSGTLLVGELQALGTYPVGETLDLIFGVTGGDAAGLFGARAGVILSNSGFPGSFASNFTSASMQAVSDTSRFVPTPATLALMLLGGGLMGRSRRRRRGDR